MDKQTHIPSLPVPVPMGAHAREDGVQFCIFSRHATRVWLLLFDNMNPGKPFMEIELDREKNRTGDIWHITVPEARVGNLYVYRMDGPSGEDSSHHFDPAQWLLDPYAKAISSSPRWGDPYGMQPGEQPHHGDTFPKGIIVDEQYDWEDDHFPSIPLEDAVIYETHVRGFTVHPSSGCRRPGTYRGLMEMIPYFKDLGITTVELLPIHEFNEMEFFMENGPRRDLRNYWGYSTLAFFAPNARYAADGTYGEQIDEFKDMIKAFHKEGIEIILDVVFNHTTEGGKNGPTYSFRGIDNSIYYMTDPGTQKYSNFTGCGNTVNCNHPVVSDFIIDCLRHWVVDMHVDGFRFDLAPIFCRGQNGEVLAHPPIVERISEDPVLKGRKLIAEAWDAAGLYQVGSFPSSKWSEWNGRYRDDMRNFWTGTPHMLRTFATRFVGSPDLYHRGKQQPQKSINLFTCHDGFTMRDLTCYEKKHNEANKEENRDGENHNHSRNFGHEGPTDDESIETLRIRQQKNMFLTLMLSRGTPMILAGDEFANSQQGNNNAYCQDNEISWLDWSLVDKHKDLRDFVKQLIQFRNEHPALRGIMFPEEHTDKPEQPFLWYGIDGNPPDWDNGSAVAVLINGKKEVTGLEEDGEYICAVFNATMERVAFQLPTDIVKNWHLEFCTDHKKTSWNRMRQKITLEPVTSAVFVPRSRSRSSRS